MQLRTFVVFKAKFPDEAIFSDTEDVFRGPGIKTVFILIGSLKKAGFPVSFPCERDYYGWVFTVVGAITFVIQHGGEKVPEGEESLLLLSRCSWFERTFRARKLEALHRSVLEKINETLKRDGRFYDARWFTEQEYNRNRDNSGGHPEP
jgi:hypothetical protein